MKRYSDLNSHLKDLFGERVQKIALDAGLGCPNRDGTISKKGCLFCDPRGSGTGAFIKHGLSISEQIKRNTAFLRKRYKARKFIAYFQSFTNTYAPFEMLKSIYDLALSYEDIVGISVGTRPDCVNEDILKLLQSYINSHLVWLEYGLQSCHDSTLTRINRGHDSACFKEAVRITRKYGLDTIAHVILGLPGEDHTMMLETARFLASLPVQGVKIHFLYVLEGTPLADLYRKGKFKCLDRSEYIQVAVDFLELLPPDMVIHRLTGDPVSSKLIAPSWAREKTRNLELIKETLDRRDTWQGRLYRSSTAGSGP